MTLPSKHLPVETLETVVNSRNIRKRCEIYPKLTIKTPRVFSLLTLSIFLTAFSSISSIDFTQLSVSWINALLSSNKNVLH